jgi:hypothetical protein
VEADELELLDKSVRHALVSAPDADDALDAIGWPDVMRCRWCSVRWAT